jgi:DNA-binding NarL/FixJ family response regulator
MLLTFEEAEEEPEAPTLSSREQEILKAIARGRGTKQTARNPGISEKTVRNHVSSIYEKLRVYDR